ncbi:MAG: hypothetical protein NZ901_09615 [Geminocystis sp.]|nr:hypothetical protein [Geminocystis sp.]HIK37179.1 hypothetical protein [Geminocystis sp. M7585_C2015_104]MCS7148430.1 hypothetical protein [Geminocystis sp.]MCX8078255.1 hypothetical protein [Geminocystis sp.]MDW8115982.1 hypothetical protein [Geminocystis sp.]
MKSNSQSQQAKTLVKPWWNRPLFGSVSLVERIWGFFHRQPLPELALSLHDTELQALADIEPSIRMLDNEQYTPEFLFYMRIRRKIESNLDDYKGLKNFVNIFSFILKHLNHFRTIRRVELDFQGKTQTELYNFIGEQLDIVADPALFRQVALPEIEKLLDIIRNEPTKNALLAYKIALEKITEEPIGLHLLSLFKEYNWPDFSIFATLGEILNRLKKQDLQNLKALVLVAKVYYEQLAKIGQIIGIPSDDSQVIIYAKIIQYIALSNRYENLVYRFEQLLEGLRKWKRHYDTLLEIRGEYPSHKYKLPPSFSQPIPGENIYIKYQEFVTAYKPI